VDNTTWDRIGASSGLLFFALFAVAFGLELADFPDPGLVAPEGIVAFVGAHRTRLGLVAVTYALSAMVFLWFLGSLRSALARVETTQGLSSIAFGGGLLTAGLLLAFSGLQLEIVFADFTTVQEPAVVSRWVLFDASGGLLAITPFPRAVFLGSASLVIVRNRGIPRWLGWFGLVGAIINLIGGFDLLAPPDVSLTGHPLADLIVFLIWVLLASGILVWLSPFSRPSGHTVSGSGVA
jgi:hypothetical protein